MVAQNKILILSANPCPFYNLSLEEYLVRNAQTDNTTYLLLYQNQNAIILGKNQNIFKEIHPKFWFHPSISICRRISGGGTVFHDLGNLNISIIEKKTFEKVNKYESSVGMVQNALHLLGIETYQNARNALFLKHNDKKISGCAQFNSEDNILSHLTLLINANTKPISEILAPLPYSIQTKASVSIPSEVCNIGDVFPIGLPEITETLISYFSPTQTVSSDSFSESDELKDIEKNITNFDFRIKRSCHCQIIFNNSTIEVNPQKIVLEGINYIDSNWENGFEKLYKLFV